MSVEKIQALRKELSQLIEQKVKPLKKELDDLLTMEAIRLCPFEIGEIITLDNGKKGKINAINYFTLDYGLSLSEDFMDYLPKPECDIDYKFAYEIDNAHFSITWNISGFRMIQNETKVGRVAFVNINPTNHLIDKERKSVKCKYVEHLVGDISDMTIFNQF